MHLAVAIHYFIVFVTKEARIREQQKVSSNNFSPFYSPNTKIYFQLKWELLPEFSQFWGKFTRTIDQDREFIVMELLTQESMQIMFYAKCKFKHLFLPFDYPQADSLNTLKRLSSASCRKDIHSEFLHYLWDRVVPFFVQL